MTPAFNKFKSFNRCAPFKPFNGNMIAAIFVVKLRQRDHSTSATSGN
jgi:hypothetical protein